jgi:hypothetical protein
MCCKTALEQRGDARVTSSLKPGKIDISPLQIVYKSTIN